MSTAQRQRVQAYAFLLVNTLCWGAAFIVVKPSLEFTTPFLMLFYRYTLAGLLMFPLLLWYLTKQTLRRHIATIIGIELIGVVLSLGFLYTGLSLTSAIETSLLASTIPIFVIIVSVLFLKEKQTSHEWLGFAISFVGILLITALPLINGQAQLSQLSLKGNLLIIISNIFSAFYVILAKRYYHVIPKLYAAAISFAVGCLAFGLLSLWQAGWSLSFWTQSITADLDFPAVQLAVVYLAIFGSIIGLTTYIKGQDHIEASEASLFYYLQPFVYIPLGILILREPISWIQLLGLILILGGVVYAEQPFARHRR